MYPDKYAVTNPDRPAFVMASTGEAVSYAEFEGRSNKLAQLLPFSPTQRIHHVTGVGRGTACRRYRS